MKTHFLLSLQKENTSEEHLEYKWVTSVWMCVCVCVSLASYRSSSLDFLFLHLKCSSWSQESTGLFLLECVFVFARLCVRKKGQSKSLTPSDWVSAPARMGTVFLVPGSHTDTHTLTHTFLTATASCTYQHLSSPSPDTSSFIHTDSKHTPSTESLIHTHTHTHTFQISSGLCHCQHCSLACAKAHKSKHTLYSITTGKRMLGLRLFLWTFQPRLRQIGQ